MKPIIILFFLISVLVACDKPNPTPEAGDPIYNDLLKEAADVSNQLKSAEKELEGFQKDTAAVLPQTGQIKYAEKRVYETSARIEKLKQMKQYWELRAETRKDWSRRNYLIAYKAKKPWPDPNEYEQYKLQRKLELAPRQWNIKQRLEQSRVGVTFDTPTKTAGPAGEPGEAKAGASGQAPPAEH